jgi:ATP-dependent DNA helicase RecG
VGRVQGQHGGPEQIGQYISALANGAARAGKSFGYLVWGIDDETHAVVGTTFDPFAAKKGNENLESWLLHMLAPKVDSRFIAGTVDGRRVVLLEIPRATTMPVQFHGDAWIRIGSYKKQLKEHPQVARQLWRMFDLGPFESGLQFEEFDSARVLELLDWEMYFTATSLAQPTTPEAVLATHAAERMIQRSERGGWDITNLGAICFARDRTQFGRLGRKALRIVRYNSAGKSDPIEERVINHGYVKGVVLAMEYLAQIVPHREVITGAVRSQRYDYPLAAVREVMTNGLIHQDFAVTGSGPMLELFTTRIDMTNPGVPPIDVDRWIDTPPTWRNEALASFMRRVGYCEERGSGIDNVMLAVELALLPAPDFRVVGDNTVVLFHGPRSFNDTNRDERNRAIYLHTCLHYVRRERVTNASVRERFGLDDAARTSRLIGEAIEANLVRVLDPTAGRRYTEYVPYWA